MDKKELNQCWECIWWKELQRLKTLNEVLMNKLMQKDEERSPEDCRYGK